MPFQSDGKHWVPPTDEEVEANRARVEDIKEEDYALLPDDLAEKIAQTIEPTSLVADFQALQKAGPVDIVIPIHNGMHIVQDCLNTLVERTKYPYNLILVDDASDEYTSNWLNKWADIAPGDATITLITNKKNRGFAGTCNRGAQHGTAPFVCFLNSDVIVTEGWLTKMVRACLSDDRNAIVNPATNNTAMVGVPMRNGMSYLDMNSMLERRKPQYPVIMPTGFCFFVRRKVLEQVGMFDEAFVSYGEESDLWMRALKCIDPDTGQFMQYRGIMADDTYVYHQRGTSFSVHDEDSWMDYRKKGANRFHVLHPDYRQTWKQEEDTVNRLRGLRETEIAGFRDEMRKKPLNITWLVHTADYCGGMKFIADIVNELQEQGVNASVTQICRPGTTAGPVLAELRSGRFIYPDSQACLDKFGHEVFADGIICTGTGELAPIAADLCKKYPNLQALNHLQSWDIGHVEDKQIIKNLKHIYKAFNNTITNAEWLTKKLTKIGAKNVGTVLPGVEKNLYYPKNRENGDDRPTVLIFLNNAYPFKEAARGVEVAKELFRLAKEAKKSIRVLGVGVHKAIECPEIICYPSVAPTRLAKMIGEEVDVVLDPSSLHSYGLPCLEAVASGVQMASWDNEGVNEYAVKTDLVLGKKATPTRMAEEIFHRLTHLPLAYPERYVLDRKEAVVEFIEVLNYKYKFSHKKNIKLVFVTPHVRKFGGPATILDTANLLQKQGYSVTVASIHSDSVNLELTNQCEVPLVFGLENIPHCDIIFVPSDSDMHTQIKESGKAKKRVLLKLSQNARFKILEEAGLNGEYDKVITSTNWLKEVTEKGQEGWNYTTQPADRVGWYNYSFNQFKKDPKDRTYHKYKGAQGIIGGLIHNHPLKGTKDMLTIFQTLQDRHGDYFKFLGIGEAQATNRTKWLNYLQSPSRASMAEVFSQVDIWLNCSHSEGLGRLALEAMSAGCAVVASDTGCEYMNDKANCLIFPVGDHKAAITNIEEIINDDKLLTNLVTQGHATAKAYANPTDYVSNFEIIIRGLL